MLLFRLGQFRTAKWVVQFLNYLISISEQDVETGKQETEEITASFYLFIFLCK